MVGLLPRGEAALESRRSACACAIWPPGLRARWPKRIEVPDVEAPYLSTPLPRRRDPASAREGGRAAPARAHRAPDVRRAGHAVLPIRAVLCSAGRTSRRATRDRQLHAVPRERRGGRVRAADAHRRDGTADRAAPGLASGGPDARRLRPRPHRRGPPRQPHVHVTRALRGRGATLQIPGRASRAAVTTNGSTFSMIRPEISSVTVSTSSYSPGGAMESGIWMRRITAPSDVGATLVAATRPTTPPPRRRSSCPAFTRGSASGP